MKDTQLLCTFSVPTDYKLLVEQVKSFYTLTNNKIFVFNNEKNNIKNLFHLSGKFQNITVKKHLVNFYSKT